MAEISGGGAVHCMGSDLLIIGLKVINVARKLLKSALERSSY